MNFLKPSVTLLALACLSVCASTAKAQNQRPTGIRVQLPVIRFFNLATTVMVPDGGTMRLGGVSRRSEGASSQGIPLLTGRPFTNRGTGFESSASHANVKVTILSSQEMSEDVLAAARAAKASQVNPNGSAAVRRKADFLSRNIGRKSRR